MAIANFFDKVALGAAPLLQGFDRDEFERILLENHIAVRFDRGAAETFEGRTQLELVVNLFARLYPVISIYSIEDVSLTKELEDMAKAINPDIELSPATEPTIMIIIGSTDFVCPGLILYAGSDNWNVKFSLGSPVGTGASNNPFGAGSAACFAAANVFRSVFKSQLPFSDIDSDFVFSVLDHAIDPASNGPQIRTVLFEDLTIAGLGAIGNSLIWSLSKLNTLNGNITLVDHENIGLSNLQRYVLAGQNDVGSVKVDLAESMFYNPGIHITKVPEKWNDWIQQQPGRRLDTVAVCVDNIKDRRLMQGSLPVEIYNAWTQQENLGISRHRDFISGTCLCCMYFPTEVSTSRSQEIADALGMSEFEPTIRKYLANEYPVDEPLIALIANFNKMEPDTLQAYLGTSVQSLYADAVCGGIFMKINHSSVQGMNPNMQVPTAFESAFAGILLGIEIVNGANHYRDYQETTTTQFNLIRALNPYINLNTEKARNCICTDPVYQDVYRKKHISYTMKNDLY
jgi:Prokaryotic E2 family C/ThiF family